MRDEALHAAVLAAPDDDGPRLVYADWLLAHGDPRGEMIALQVERARTQDATRKAELLAREQLLWDVHGRSWRPSITHMSIEHTRGFIEHLRCWDLWQLAIHLDALLDWACVERLHIADSSDADLAFVVGQFPRMVLRELSFDFAFSQLSTEELSLLRGSAELGRLKKLGLRRACSPEGLIEVAHWPHPRTLQSLDLSFNQFGPPGFKPFVEAEAFAALEHLYLAGTNVSSADLEAVIAAELPLVTLDLDMTTVGPTVAAAIANAPHLAGLRRLNLSRTQIGAEGLAALLASPYLDRELQLVLDGDLFGLPGKSTAWDHRGSYFTTEWLGQPPAPVMARFRAEIREY